MLQFRTMAVIETTNDDLLLGIAHALFMNRLHVLRLTEVVRLGIRPNKEDQNLEVPGPLDRELIEQSVAYLLKCFPKPMHKKILAAKSEWLSPA